VSEVGVLGWREWVGLPQFGIDYIKAKVDTGARTSALHAFVLESFERDGRPWVRFEIHPWQRSDDESASVEAPVVEWRSVRSSSGDEEDRPVLRTPVAVGGRVVRIELTLTRRDQMGFRMLLGREAVRRRFLVDPGRSYLGGRLPTGLGGGSADGGREGVEEVS
jgi:hypothetical protein